MSGGAAARPLTIAFAMLAEEGHHTGTFRLARALSARGHRILYLGLADAREWVRAQGFEFMALAEDLLPAGYARRGAGDQMEKRDGRPAWRRRRRAAEQVFAEFLGRINGGGLDRFLQAHRPDLLLCDTFVWYIALRAIRLGIPTLNLSVILSGRSNRNVPPIVSPLCPRPTAGSALRVLAAWKWLRVKHFFTKRLASALWGSYRAPTRMHHLSWVFRRLARNSGYPCRENKTYWIGEMGPRLARPELVLCPRAFQLPGAPDDGRIYVGDFVDLDRKEVPRTPPIPDGQGPLIYCSLGSGAIFYPHRRRFCQAVVEACRRRNDWRFVLQVSDPDALAELKPGPNLVVAARVPQLAILRQAAVMVTHGGLNSIMECVQLGVPMVIVPGLRDQPGNAVRAARLGLGWPARMATLTGSQLVELIGRAMGDPLIRDRLLGLKQAMIAGGGLAVALDFLESQSVLA